MYNSLAECRQQLEGIQAIDYFLAREICKAQKNKDNEVLFHSIMLTSQALRQGHTCLKIDAHCRGAGFGAEKEILYWQNSAEDKPGYAMPSYENWHQELSKFALSISDNQPLVYENKRLYLRRYWQFEQELASTIRDLMNKPTTLSDRALSDTALSDTAQAQQVMEQLFPDSTDTQIDKQIDKQIDWQKVAVANALLRPFTIITGGPGTGKTFTVTKVLAALQTLAHKQLKIAMIAPTGKAAQRLNESIQNAKTTLYKNKLADKELLDSIPDTASTVHRLLGVIPGRHDFRYNKERLLPYDVLLIDEISMLDLPLITRLLRAVAKDCRIIMLGDADQLPSVAAGSVLSDLAPIQAVGYSKKGVVRLNELTHHELPVLDANNKALLNLDHLTILQHSYRFDSGGAIGQLAKQVIAGNRVKSVELLQQVNRVTDKSYAQWLDDMLEQYYVPLITNKGDINDAFAQLKKFRFLVATRVGGQGVIDINMRLEQSLMKKGLIPLKSDFYHGKPIMVTENHYNIGLYNGDTGLLWENKEGILQAAFPENDSVRWLSLGRLPKVETVYAMTIHKTQGSEFQHVALVLPEQESLVLSRELLYTGITRASEQLTVFAEQRIFEWAVKRKVERYSGLEDKVFCTE